MTQRNTRLSVRRRVAACLAFLLLVAASPAAAQPWTVGKPISPPPEVTELTGFVTAKITAGENDPLIPAPTISEHFFYDQSTQKAYWLQPTPAGATATITWPTGEGQVVCSNDPCQTSGGACSPCTAPVDVLDPTCTVGPGEDCVLVPGSCNAFPPPGSGDPVCEGFAPSAERVGVANWPASAARILHVSGAPVDLAPRDPDNPSLASSDWSLVGGGVVHPKVALGSNLCTNNTQPPANPALPCVDPNSKIFNRFLQPGETVAISVIQYNEGPTITGTHVAFQVVETVASDDPRIFDTVVQAAQPCTVGSELKSPRVVLPGSHIPRTYHRDLTGKTGFVLNPLAFFDGSGPNRAYDRPTRSGQIIPVNSKRTTESTQGEAMAVVWYRDRTTPQFDEDPAIPVAWPDYPVLYNPPAPDGSAGCAWPSNPKRIVIASGEGSELDGQPELTDAAFPAKEIYRQRDTNLPGYNPNDEHAAFAASNTGTESAALYALRSELHSDPYVLLKYRKPIDPTQWDYEVYEVTADDPGAGHEFAVAATAGDPLSAPTPLGSLGLECASIPAAASNAGRTQWTVGPLDEVASRTGGAHHADSRGGHWAAAEGDIKAEFYYTLRNDFFFDEDQDGLDDGLAGSCVPWLSKLTSPNDAVGTPVDFSIRVDWPSLPLTSLKVGETLTRRVRGLPEIRASEGVRVVAEFPDTGSVALPAGSLVRLFDPESARGVPLRAALLDKLPPEIDTITRLGQQIPVGNNKTGTTLSAALRERLTFDPLAATGDKALFFAGTLDMTGAGMPRLLPNVMSIAERDELQAVCCDDPAFESAWDATIQDLLLKTRDPSAVVADASQADTDVEVGFEPGLSGKQPVALTGVPKALSAGLAQSTGWVSVARNDDATLSGPVDIQVIKLECGPFGGEIKIVPSENIFEEALSLRHSGDFMGQPELREFEWWRHPAPKPDPGEFPHQANASDLWVQFGGSGADPGDAPVTGQVEVTIDAGDAEVLLSDNYFFARYKGYDACGSETWSQWAGSPGSITRSPLPQLAESWIKRVIRRLNPFDARVQDFHSGPAVNTISSQISQAGPRYEGDIAFSEDPDNLNDIGLIETYETVLRRGTSLSIDAPMPISSPGVNQALLFAASRIGDLYMLLGNEAFGDAADPTIAVGTDDAQFGSLAPSIFSFQNQLPSLLDEELALLRGRDDSGGPTAAAPIYNRLFWNFTSGTGQVAYKLNYDVTDQDLSGIIDTEDAKVLFPQGHGDAWGHYLSAIKSLYRLLRNPQYGWLSRAEDVVVAGVPIQVDFLDERKFALAATARAKAGAQILDLTYREAYVGDPEGQWQGYKDTDAQRAWGVDEWGRRAAQGAYFDWVVANAILPSQDLDPNHEGVQIIDRQRVTELGDVSGQLSQIQAQMQDVDLGLNPLGLADGAVPFDISPALVIPPIGEPQTHFEQIYDRALAALDNAVDVWDFANQLTQRLRSTQDDADEFLADSKDQELDFRNRLIEIFGTPYAGDIGPAGSYPTDYEGADLYHWMYVDARNLTGQRVSRPSDQLLTLVGQFRPIGTYCPVETEPGQTPTGCPPDAQPGESKSELFFDDVGGSSTAVNDSVDSDTILTIDYPIDPNQEYRFQPLDSWGERQAPGEIQFAFGELLQSQLALKQALLAYDNKIEEIEDEADLIDARFAKTRQQITLVNDGSDDVSNLRIAIGVAQAVAAGARLTSRIITDTSTVIKDAVPKTLPTGGFSFSPGDALAFVRSGASAARNAATITIDTIADASESTATFLDNLKDDGLRQVAIDVDKEDQRFEVQQELKLLESLLRDESELRAEIFAAQEVVKQSVGRKNAAFAKGLRLLEERVDYRTGIAAATSEGRYRDMAFRIFRNDALQKYKAQFDLAAKYAYLAATAYDYETNLVGTDNAAGRRFLTDIVRHRSLGQVIDGQPVVGTTGLADPLARMAQNFAVQKSQLGFNNPRLETNRFSLRKELFREVDESAGASNDDEWRAILQQSVVSNLCSHTDFRRFARPFAPDSACPQPGIVIEFPSVVEFDKNFFGKLLGPGDSAFDPTFFATRVRSVGVWFENYDLGSLSNTPRAYLLPVGEDVLLAPTSGDFRTREWRVIDQALPVPFPIGANDLQDPDWIPLHDTLSDSFATIRRFSAFRAYHDDGSSETVLPEELNTDSRLIGRSVWNTRWVLVIPGGFMLNDPDAGLDGFIDSVTDIRVFFETYGYSGN